MTDWAAVWERKGQEASCDPREFDGFGHTAIDPREAAAVVTRLLRIEPGDRVLDVGCGAGMIARYLGCDYVGLDRSGSLLRRHRELLGSRLVRGAAQCLAFADASFDKVLVFSVFHYLPSHAQARVALAELERVSRCAVFVGDLPATSHDPSHLLFTPAFFAGWDITPGFYTTSRFNAVRWYA